MITSISFLAFAGFYFQYCTSERIQTPEGLGFEGWAATHAKISNSMGLALMLLSCILCIVNWGLGAGIFGFLILVMTIGSLILLAAPLKLINRIFVLVALLGMLTFENLHF
ncbi:MAG TPA: hypothetical protein VFM69_07015 [Pricia sp.]|nr:hypothetical protein [Pricia sp.]